MKKLFIKIINSVGLYTRSQSYDINMVDFTGLRCSGRTTRLADAYIQLLFTTGEIHVKDHHSKGMKSSLRLRDIILHRLSMEHGFASQYLEVEYNCIKLPLKNLCSNELDRLRSLDAGMC